MDRLIQKKTRNYKKLMFIFGSIFLAAYAVHTLMLSNMGVPSVSKDKLRIGEVKRGKFDVLVSGNGVVSAKDPDWIVSKVSGQVIKSSLKSGERIKKGDVLVALINEDLVSALARSDSELRASKADFTVLDVSLSSQMSSYESDVLKAELDYKQVFVTYNALNNLRARGSVPIPELEYANAKIKVEQMNGLVDIAKIRLNGFKKIKRTQVDAFKYRLASIEEENIRLKNRVNDLRIIASRDGIIQNLSLTIGQGVNAGDLIGQVVDPLSVYVTLSVPAIHAFKLAPAQTVDIELNRKHIKGIVHRIDPNIKGTTVDVDVYFSEEVTDAKVGMFINGTVSIQSIPDTLYIDIPSHMAENGNMSVFLLSADDSFADIKTVRSGSLSTNYLQILSGLNVGDRIILSEIPNINNVNKLRLK